MKEYPSPNPESRYRRTFKLKRGWKRRVRIGANIDIQLFNEIGYAGYVQGRRFTGDPKQTKRAQKQGWFSLTDVNRTIWPPHRDKIARALGIKSRFVRNIRLGGSFDV